MIRKGRTRGHVPSFIFFMFGISCLLHGCGTMSNGRHWGEDATPSPGWAKVSQTAWDAITSPMFFVPASAALLLRIGNADTRLSNWAVDHTPVFGSNDRADKASTQICNFTSYAYYLSALATPGGTDPGGWAISKAKGALVQGAALGLDTFLVGSIKDASGRERPNGSDNQSFPSGTTAKAASFAVLASRNVDAMSMPWQAKTVSNVGLYSLMCATAWGRVEAGDHYPTDVLAAISLSYFVSAWVNDTFMGNGSENKGSPVMGYNGKDLFIGYSMRF